MKHSGSLTLVTSLLSVLPTAYSLVGSSWSVTNVPSTGLTDITFPITIVQANHGYNFAQQFNFVGVNDIGYIGIQPRPNIGGKAVLRGVFSSFIDGTTTHDVNCSPGADGGPGVSCSVEWNGVYGRKYNLEVIRSSGTLWIGVVFDTVTDQRIHIGTYTLPAGSQGILNSQVGFVEYDPWNSGTHHCTSLPYQKTVFGNPSTSHAGSIGTQGESYEYGDCVGKVAFQIKRVTGGVENNCGFH